MSAYFLYTDIHATGTTILSACSMYADMHVTVTRLCIQTYTIGYVMYTDIHAMITGFTG